jgi:hypothetical protein
MTNMTNLIRAVVVDPGVPERLVIREVEPPLPLPHQARSPKLPRSP